MSQAGRLEETGSGNTSVNEIDADVGVALPIAGVINIVGGTGISTSASGNTVTINFTGNVGLSTLLQCEIKTHSFA